MAGGEALKIDARRSSILNFLARDGQVRISQLSEALSTTVVTIRSDLAALERDGYCERIVGGAIQTVKNFYNQQFQLEKQKNLTFKKAIAKATAELVQDGETLMVNSGTTTYFTAIELKQRKNLSIVTNSVSIAIELGSHPSFHIILLGGEINSQFAFTCGNDAIAQLKRYKADKVLLSVDGASPDTGLTTRHAKEAELNQVMLERSRQTIVVADYTKLEHESFFNFGELTNTMTLITNDCADPKPLDQFAAKGVTVIRCRDFGALA